MHVAHVITDLGTGGAEMMLLKLVQSRAPQFQHSVISLKGLGSVGAPLRAAGASVRALSLSGGRIPGVGAVRIAKALREADPDIVQGWMYHGNLAATFGHLFIKRGCPLFWSIRCSLSATQSQALTRHVIRWGAALSKWPTGIIYNAEQSRRQHEAAGYSSARGCVIPNGFDLRVFAPSEESRMKCRAQLGVSEKERLIGLVARLHPVKDHETFVLAARELHRTAPHLRFAVIGPGVERLESVVPTLKPAIRELGSALMMVGEVRDVAAMMNAFDVCVLTSLAEGFPNVIGEAMACGVPCVVTDVGDCREIVGDTGITVPARSPSAVANAVLSVLSSDIPARGTKARLRISSYYSIDQVVNRYQIAWSNAAGEVAGHFHASAGA